MTKPCPFCGGTDIRHTAGLRRFRITKCMSCQATGPAVDPDKFRGDKSRETDHMRRDEAYRLWNTRMTNQ